MVFDCDSYGNFFYVYKTLSIYGDAPLLSNMNINDILKKISPILIKPDSDSIKISFSRRFFLFSLMSRIINIIEEDPNLNFIALLKSYKVLGNFLNGTLHEFYRDRNKIYFKNFFIDRHLYSLVKQDIEDLYPKHKDIKMTITKRGVIIYDNYKKSAFNVLLMSIHSGTWVQDSIDKKLNISKIERFKEEDVDTHKIYRDLVLEKSGIWIDNKQSRFVIDFNRGFERAIYADNSEEWLEVVWREKLTKKEVDGIYSSYEEFYFTLSKLIEAFHFNIIFDAHSMKHRPGRPSISFCTEFIPKFYMPVVKSMQKKMRSLGYDKVLFDVPFKGGYILRYLRDIFPHMFIFSMEVNKNLYMTKDRMKTIKYRMNKLSQDLMNIFDIETEDEVSK